MANKSIAPHPVDSAVTGKELKSCFKSYYYLRRAIVQARSSNPVYSPDSKYYKEDRESRVKEWKEGYQPYISPIHLRKHRRNVSFNPHFWRYPKSKARIKYELFVRLAIIDLSLQNGLGGRFRLAPPKRKTFDYPMSSVSKVIFGSGCMKYRLRKEACLEIIRLWDQYKWAIKHSYSMHIQFFRIYDPDCTDDSIHKHGMYLYKAAIYHKMYDSKPLELRVACEIHEHNFYCIESCGDETFKVCPSGTEFDKSVYFFAKEIPYAGKLVDPAADDHKNYYLIWLNPIIRASKNLIMDQCVMRITYSNPNIGYFHLFEEDPDDTIDMFDYTNNKKKTRHRYIQFSPIVNVLHYFQRFRFHIWDFLCRCGGCWFPREVDERILSYNPEQVDRYHRLEFEFMRMVERSKFGINVNKRKRKFVSKLVEDYIYSLKHPEVVTNGLWFHRCERIRKNYAKKQKRIKLLNNTRNLKHEARKYPNRNKQPPKRRRYRKRKKKCN